MEPIALVDIANLSDSGKRPPVEVRHDGKLYHGQDLVGGDSSRKSSP